MDIANYLYSTRGSVGGDAAGIYDARVLESPQTACVKRGLDSRYAACLPPSVDAAANYGRAAARQGAKVLLRIIWYVTEVEPAKVLCLRDTDGLRLILQLGPRRCATTRTQAQEERHAEQRSLALAVGGGDNCC